MIVQFKVFEFDCIRFFQKCFLKANYLGPVAAQKVLEFFIVGRDSSAVPLYESWATCFVWIVVGVYYDGLGLFFFLFLLLFDSSILFRRLNLVSAVWFWRVDTFSHSGPVDDGAWSILDCGERSCLSQFSWRFRLSNLDKGGRIGDLWVSSFAGDFFVGGGVWAIGFVCWLVGWLVGWLFYFGCFTGFSLFALTGLGWVWSSTECRSFSCFWNFSQSFSSSLINFSTRALYLLSWLPASAPPPYNWGVAVFALVGIDYFPCFSERHIHFVFHLKYFFFFL